MKYLPLIICPPTGKLPTGRQPAPPAADRPAISRTPATQPTGPNSVPRPRPSIRGPLGHPDPGPSIGVGHFSALFLVALAWF